MRFVVRRLSMFLFTLWAAMTLNFFIPRFMPGNPLQALEARTRAKLSPAALESILSSFGYKPNAGLVPQYFTYLKDMLTGQWGQSIGLSLGEPVRDIIFQALPWTLGLIGLTTVIAFVLGNVAGIVAGWRRGGTLDSWLPSTLVVTANLPYYWIGMLLILLFATTLNWLPADFNYDPSILPGLSPGYIGSVAQHAVLPAFTLLITSIGGWILTMRNNMITTVAEDYVRMARAKGLSDRKIMFNYAARNAMLPNISGFAMSLGFVLSGSVLVEYVFNYPGLGYQLLNAVDNNDYPLMQVLFMLYTIAVLVSLLVADFFMVWLDPRAREKG
ncbi:ABC transporter permease [Actinospica sp.]|jgi:peptide/nickel transport system permease protein|uniref:ABC transporter permease n=1 Tax=Actinospica sp. TaxID=1872142 RepID=UPI002BA0A8A4|nr:ABC transporter permease [Actinospica sp.]HWG27423.1 ABC transporter permease [Actinospica sp.]